LPTLATPLNVTLGDDVVLLDADVSPPTTAQPRTVRVSLRWRVLRQPAQNLSLFVHLLDATGHRWAQSDGQGYFSTDWQPGDEVVTTEDIQLPVGTPTVPLQVSVDFYDVATGTLLPRSATAPGNAPDGGVVIGHVTALPSGLAATDVIPGARAPVDIAPGLRLLGAALPSAPATAGSSFDVTLYLQKTAQQTGAAPSVTLQGATASDSEPLPAAPLLASLPTGDVLAVRHVVTVSARDVATTATLQLHTAAAALPLGQIRLTPLPRSYAAPTPQHPLSVRFGTLAELLGYDEAVDANAHRLTLTLYWRALATTDVPYTVFNHFVDPNNHLLAQHDGIPADGRWPTTSWLPGQIIVDHQNLVLPAGVPIQQAILQVGLYAAQAPAQPRLAATGPAGETGDTYAVLHVGG
jgi:hypothetical protein